MTTRLHSEPSALKPQYPTDPARAPVRVAQELASLTGAEGAECSVVIGATVSARRRCGCPRIRLGISGAAWRGPPQGEASDLGEPASAPRHWTDGAAPTVPA